MSPPRTESSAPWSAVLLVAGVLLVAAQLRHRTLVLATLSTLLALPVAWRLLTRRWVRGDVVRGLAMGFVSSHLPLLLGVLLTLRRPECRVRLCLEGLLSLSPLVPWAALLGALLYWAFAPPPPAPSNPPHFPPEQGPGAG